MACDLCGQKKMVAPMWGGGASGPPMPGFATGCHLYFDGINAIACDDADSASDAPARLLRPVHQRLSGSQVSAH